VVDWGSMTHWRNIKAAVPVVGLALGLSLLAASCGTAGVITTPQSSAPLRSSVRGIETTGADGGSREVSIALVIVHNAAPGPVRVLGVATHTIGRLDVDGASLESVPSNRPGEGVTRTPIPATPGASWAAITRSQHPLVRAGSNEALIVRVHVPPGEAGGATLSVSVRYRTDGTVYRTTYPMTYMLCAGAFDGGLCNQLRDRMLAQIALST